MIGSNDWGATVLIVDDSEDYRRILSSFLEEEGYQVTLAACGEDAFDLLRTQIVDLVITDLQMPDGDGFWLIHKIRTSIYSHLPVLLVSGHPEMTTEKARARGATSFLPKPYTPECFLSLLREILPVLNFSRSGDR